MEQPPILGLAKKRRYSETAVLGVIYITKTLIWDLKMGGGIGREAILGGAVLRGRLYKLFIINSMLSLRIKVS